MITDCFNKLEIAECFILFIAVPNAVPFHISTPCYDGIFAPGGGICAITASSVEITYAFALRVDTHSEGLLLC